MKFFKPKIIIEKRYKYLKIDKKANFQKILLNIISLIIFLIILKKIIPIINNYELYSFSFFTSFVLILNFFLFFIILTFKNLSNESLEMDSKRIVIKKKFIFFCYYNREITIKEITRITYKGWNFITAANIFNNINNSITIQVNTGLEEDEEFFFGTGIDLKTYAIFQKALKEILGENHKKLDFIYAKY